MTVSQGWWPRLIDLFIVCSFILFCGLVVYYCSMLKHLDPETGECIVFGTATSGECFCVWLLWLFAWAWFKWTLPLSLCYVEIQKKSIWKETHLQKRVYLQNRCAINGLKSTVFHFFLQKSTGHSTEDQQESQQWPHIANSEPLHSHQAD